MKMSVETKTGEICQVRIEIPDVDDKKLDALFKAENALREAGISFDTGFDVREGRRDWKFDWSLSGARVKFYRFGGGNPDNENPESE